MTTPQFTSLELLSALTDGEVVRGELTGDDSVFLSGALKSDWNSYQVIGHALRGVSGDALLKGADPTFLQRLNSQLAKESMSPPVVAVYLERQVPSEVHPTLQPAANEAVFRWKLAAGFASAGAALVVAWSFVGAPDASTASQLSQNPAAEQVVVSSSQGPIVRDARLEELMAAHKQVGGSSLQGSSGFLRYAGFEESSSGRR